MIERVCKQCGKVFWVKPYIVRRGEGKFCSNECNNKYHTKKVKKVCPVCGVIFSSKPSSKRKFCSRACYEKERTENPSNVGENNPAWRGGKKEVTCIQCGKVFLEKPGRADQRKFCSQKCHIEYKQTMPSPKQIERICPICGKAFYMFPSQLKVSACRCCSKECAAKWRSRNIRGKNHPTYSQFEKICPVCGKHFMTVPSINQVCCSRHCAGKKRMWSDKGIHTRPTKPELIFEGICKKYALPFRYVGNGELWIGKTKKLNPDFIECNGKKIIIEVLGDYWHSPLLNRNLPEHGDLKYRKKHYSKYKWKSIFLWETDLKRDDAEAFILSTLKKEGVI